MAGDEAGSRALEQALAAAASLPGEGWRTRLMEERPRGPCESFLALLRCQVLARNADDSAGYGLECQTQPLWDGLDAAARALAESLARIETPLGAAQKASWKVWTRRPANWRARPPGGLMRWPAAFSAAPSCRLPPGGACWPNWRPRPRRSSALVRPRARRRTRGRCRHVPPLGRSHRTLCRTLLASAQGAVITSATLTDGSEDQEADWNGAEARSGAAHLPAPALRSRLASPFDYVAQTRVYLVRDLPRGDLRQLAGAYRALFLAAGGGALGLFTAISRLRAVQAGIAPALDEAGLTLLSQHVDGMDTATLVEIFRAEEDSCLLGTDAVPMGRRARPLAAPDRLRPGALAAPGPAPQGTTRALRRAPLRRPAGPPETEAGLRQADPPPRRQGSLRRPRPGNAPAPNRRLSARRHSRTGRSRRGGDRRTGFPGQ